MPARTDRAAPASQKIVVRDLSKVFGAQPEQALQRLAQGQTKEQIFRDTGMVVGVQDATFSVNEGEIFVLMGLSGSGKSTLVRLLNRLVEPTRGQVLVDGRDVASMSRAELVALRRRDMAMVFQSFALLPHLSVLDNTVFGLEIAGVPRREREKRALEVLDQVGLAAFAAKRPAQLSGGMQQRVGLARALATDPSLMLMDEAFSALDPLKRTEMQSLLLQLQKDQQRTIVFVSHDLEEAFRLGDRIAIMEGGRIVQIGAPDDILRNPGDAYVRAFFKGVDVKKYYKAGDVADAELAVVLVDSDDASPDLAQSLDQLLAQGAQEAHVVDTNGRWLGSVTPQSLSAACARGGVQLREALQADGAAVAHDTSLAQLVAEVMRSSAAVPVVDAEGGYLGAVNARSLLKVLSAREAADD